MVVNQPTTDQKDKSGVLRKRKTSSLARPFLRTKRIAAIGKLCLINCNLGCAYANRIVVLAEGLDMFRLGAIATVGRMIPSGNFSFTKRTLVEWMPGNSTQNGWHRFG
jgi:hypothetical protein